MGVRKKNTSDLLKTAKKSKAFATLKKCPTSPRKMRLIADNIRGMNVNKALKIHKGLLIRQNIDYIKLKSNDILLKKINQIAKKNKVLLNPNFNVVDLTKIKNIENMKRKLI